MSLTQFWSIKKKIKKLKRLEASLDRKKFFQILSRRSGHGAPPRGNAPEEPKFSLGREGEERERESASGRASRPLLVISARQENGGRMDDEWMTDRQTDI